MKKPLCAALLCALALALSSCPGPSLIPTLPAPSGITVVAVGTTALRISWSSVAEAEGYNLYRAGSQAGTYVRVNDFFLTESTLDDRGLAADTEYWYKVVALRDGEEQTMSAAHSGTTDPEPLGAPANVKVLFLGGAALRISWDALTDADGYSVYRSGSQYGSYAKVNAAPTTSLELDDTGLVPATEYWYRVAGSRSGVEQAQSEPAEGFTSYRWARSYGGASFDSAACVRQTSDGGYIIAGHTASFGAGSDDAWVARLAPDGSVSWQKCYGGIAVDRASSVAPAADGGYIVAGTTSSFGAGGTDGWVMKLDSDGTVSWQKSYGVASDESLWSIQATSDGGYVAAGSCSVSSGSAWVLKLASDGTVSWQKSYGGAFEDAAAAIQQTADGGYIVAGSTVPTASSPLADVWLLRLLSDGSIDWQKSYNGGGTDAASAVQQTGDGGYIVAGKTISAATDSWDQWVLKIDVDGGVTWLKTFGVYLYSGGVYDDASAVAQAADGGYLVAGRTRLTPVMDDDLVLLKLGVDGTLLWKKCLGGDADDAAHSLQATADGGFVVAGTSSSFGAVDGEAWVLKFPASEELYGASFLKVISQVTGSFSAGITTTTVSPLVTSASAGDTGGAAQDTGATVATQYP